jgi:uncharacterized protein (DUF924 family)
MPAALLMAGAAHAEPAQRATPSAGEVVAFWREAGPQLWFAKDPAFDARFRDRFADAYAAAAAGRLDSWMETPEGALGLIILLDQYPRNAFRGTPRMYATDAAARAYASQAVARRLHERIDLPLRLFIILPFGHSEDQADQDRSVELAEQLGEPSLSHARGHQAIVRRFGRFPHRNEILGRRSTAEERSYLAAGGFAG